MKKLNTVHLDGMPACCNFLRSIDMRNMQERW